MDLTEVLTALIASGVLAAAVAGPLFWAVLVRGGGLATLQVAEAVQVAATTWTNHCSPIRRADMWDRCAADERLAATRDLLDQPADVRAYWMAPAAETPAPPRPVRPRPSVKELIADLEGWRHPLVPQPEGD